MTSLTRAIHENACGRPLSLDEDTRRDGLTARRNVLFGLWAARRLGLPHAEHDAYAWSVHFADFEAPGDADVIAKVSRDLAERGVGLPTRQLRYQLDDMELRAFLQLSAAKPRSRARRSARTPRRAA